MSSVQHDQYCGITVELHRLNVAAARNSVTIFLLPFCYGWSSVTYAKGDKKALKNISLQIL